MPASPESAAAFAPLLVFDRLEVGPVQLEKKRLTMPYRLFTSEQMVENELIYSYDEPVFEPTEPESLNLAAMIGAQVALNYGLFCQEIVFHGIFDRADQRFLRDMMENTSREIYFNKIISDNPFLTGDAAQVPFVKQKRYTQALIRFESAQEGPRGAHWRHWAGDPDSYCVLSSGGKDSLVSYGLLKELGKVTHPIFINEAGRHWFTAINAFRYLEANEPLTARVWSNSDRIFTWFLRQMPFIRPDFANLRADDYPIRLWTVAVFLFGVLPLVRKRAIGNLLIGDEYDSTRRVSYQGVMHYEGLYDQSRFFDEAVSRFFMKKGWALRQYSILRPLSELMILELLVKRYPELQAQQVSCHASHKEDDRIKPCGKCEKCRRIVGMLTALGESPLHCGYTASQVKACLAALATEKVKQLGPEAAQLTYMLAQKGLLSPTKKQEKLREYDYVLKLRFDKERSPAHVIPVRLRKELYPLLLQHALGAVKRVGGKWTDFDLLNDRDMLSPYPFELLLADQEKQPSEPTETENRGYLWGELTWPEAKERIGQMDIALLPTGAIEQHGPHLPLDIDAFDASYLAQRVAAACSQPRPLVLPLVPYGVSYHHDDFPGTISVSNESLSRMIYDIGMSLARNGIKKLIIINGHGDNAPTLNYAAQMINRDAGIFVAVDTGESSDVDLDRLISTPNDVHAGETETSTALATRPHLVKMELARKMIPTFSSRYLDFSSQHAVPWYTHTHKISEDGTLGDPTKATAEKGRQMWEIMIAHLVVMVEELKGLTLEEIYQARY